MLAYVHILCNNRLHHNLLKVVPSMSPQLHSQWTYLLDAINSLIYLHKHRAIPFSDTNKFARKVYLNIRHYNYNLVKHLSCTHYSSPPPLHSTTHEKQSEDQIIEKHSFVLLMAT